MIFWSSARTLMGFGARSNSLQKCRILGIFNGLTVMWRILVYLILCMFPIWWRWTSKCGKWTHMIYQNSYFDDWRNIYPYICFEKILILCIFCILDNGFLSFFQNPKFWNFHLWDIYSLVRRYSYGKQTIWSINDILQQMTRAYIFLHALKKLLTSVHVF